MIYEPSVVLVVRGENIASLPDWSKCFCELLIDQRDRNPVFSSIVVHCEKVTRKNVSFTDNSDGIALTLLRGIGGIKGLPLPVTGNVPSVGLKKRSRNNFIKIIMSRQGERSKKVRVESDQQFRFQRKSEFFFDIVCKAKLT